MKNIKKLMLSCAWLCVYCVIILAVLLTSKVSYGVSVDSDAEEGDLAGAIVVGSVGSMFEEMEQEDIIGLVKEMRKISLNFNELKTQLYGAGLIDQGAAYHYAAMSCRIAPLLLIFLLICVGFIALVSVITILITLKRSKNPKFVKEAESSGAGMNFLKTCRFAAFLPLIIYGCYWLPVVLTNSALAKTLGGSSAYKIGFYFEGLDLLVFAIAMLIIYFVVSYIIEKVMNPKPKTK